MTPPLSLALYFCFFFSYYCDHRDLHSFPTRRSSDLIPRRQRNLRAADRVAPGIEYRSPKEIRIAERETHRHARSSREAPDIDALRVDRIALHEVVSGEQRQRLAAGEHARIVSGSGRAHEDDT